MIEYKSIEKWPSINIDFSIFGLAIAQGLQITAGPILYGK